MHFVTGGPFGLHGFGRFAGLPSEDLQQHGVIYPIVFGFAAAGIAAMLFFCEESNAGKAFRAIRKDPLLAQSQGINVSASKLCFRPARPWSAPHQGKAQQRCARRDFGRVVRHPRVPIVKSQWLRIVSGAR